ncbi:MAG: hypothetical protein LLF76_06095 [Planctomycetaceae bacterium]|nr:hypothetical protein [Planctomycetaceae bacterium]
MTITVFVALNCVAANDPNAAARIRRDPNTAGKKEVRMKEQDQNRVHPVNE